MRQTMRAMPEDPYSRRAPSVGPVIRAAGRLAASVMVLVALDPGSFAGVAAQEGPARAAQVEPSQRTGPVEPHPEAQEAIGRLKSPYCPGLMLEVCPSPQAGELRDRLQMMAEQGADADSLVEWMLARYGQEYRAVPRTEGSGLLAWIVPPLALLLGGGLVVLVLARIRGDDEERIDAEAVRSLSTEDQERLADALSRMEREGR